MHLWEKSGIYWQHLYKTPMRQVRRMGVTKSGLLIWQAFVMIAIRWRDSVYPGVHKDGAAASPPGLRGKERQNE